MSVWESDVQVVAKLNRQRQADWDDAILPGFFGLAQSANRGNENNHGRKRSPRHSFHQQFVTSTRNNSRPNVRLLLSSAGQ